MYQPLVGLNDTKFDANLHLKEIDHDFFDNPSGSAGACLTEQRTSDAANKKLSEDSLEDSDNIEKTNNQKHNVELPNQVENTGEEAQDDGLTAQKPEDAGYQPLGQCQLSLSTTTPRRYEDLETPETCVSSPNLGFFALPNQQMFSTGKLLECLPNSEHGLSSGPQSSFFNQYFEKQEGSLGNEQSLMSQNASFIQQHHSNEGRLFDDESSNSSEDSDSDSEISDLESLDTEDEEFVNLLEKYYDYIDLGESDYSDITEVSPMSSMTASPLPPFAGGADSTEESNNDNEQEPNSSGGDALSLPTMSRFPASPKRQILKPKPLPPLIIHTLEEMPTSMEPKNRDSVEIDLEQNARRNFSAFENSNMASLLMKVEKGDDKSEAQKTIPGVSNDDFKDPTNVLVFQGDGGSPSSTPSKASRFSLGSATGSSFSRTGSSMTMSSSGSFSGHKRPAKNHSFTPDQMRRIEKDNSILMKKIQDTTRNHHGHGHHHWSHTKAAIHHHRYGHHFVPKSSASIARQRQQKRIDHENSILIRRLQSVKPSKEIESAFRTNNNLKCT